MFSRLIEIENLLKISDNKIPPPTCQSLRPVYPSPHGGSEDDDGGSDDQAVGGGETEVVALEFQHVTTSSKPPHVVPPGGESMRPIHPPGHPSLNLQTEQSGREGTVKWKRLDDILSPDF